MSLLDGHLYSDIGLFLNIQNAPNCNSTERGERTEMEYIDGMREEREDGRREERKGRNENIQYKGDPEDRKREENDTYIMVKGNYR